MTQVFDQREKNESMKLKALSALLTKYFGNSESKFLSEFLTEYQYDVKREIPAYFK